jgi:molybdopterin biosynthesis enzyme
LKLSYYIPLSSKKTAEKGENKSFIGLPEVLPKAMVTGEDIPVEQALNRVLAEEVKAVVDDPPYSRANADGYLLLSTGTALASKKRPLTFEVVGEIPPPSHSVELPFGRALRVKNGSYLAVNRFLEGHYAVMKESESTEIDSKIYVIRLINKHENIGVQGSIRQIGNLMFSKGHRLLANDIFTLADQRIATVKVAIRPKVAILSLGEDLIPMGGPYKIGYRYDSISVGLSAMVTALGGIPILCGIMPPTRAPLTKKLIEIMEEADMAILSGTVISLQREFAIDLILGACADGVTDPVEIAHIQKKAIFSEEMIRPTVIGIVKKKPVLCIAGEIADALSCMRQFGWPTISHLLGESTPGTAATCTV